MKFTASGKASFFGALALTIGMIAASNVQAQTVTIQPDTPVMGNCYPFAVGGVDRWPPYMAFVYKNVPAFSLGIGDTFAFDLGNQNDYAIELQIDLVATTTNGGNEPAGSFTTIVTNTQTPANPYGDDVFHNYELQFAAESNFDFPGGGLIIRFSNPSTAYQGDDSCDDSAVLGSASDTSGYFVERGYHDQDGVPPWDNVDPSAIAAFRVNATGVVIMKDTPVPAMSVYGLILVALAILLLAFQYFPIVARRK